MGISNEPTNSIKDPTLRDWVNAATTNSLYEPTNLVAFLQWTVTTNWHSAGQSRTLLAWSGEGKDPNTTTYYENGTISSNLIALVTWKGKVSGVVIESIPFAITNRSYTLKTEEYREYR